MSHLHADKILVDHLCKKAYIYVRQSTIQQVRQNRESTRRQYGLKQRALELGWPEVLIEVIDDDLGESGTDTQRSGFQHLVVEVGMRRVGAIFSLGASRLARNNAAWHRLLELCAMTHTLIIDEQVVYDPCDFNDRTLLGLQGLFVEAELHILRDRLLKGRERKAARGELRITLPAGYVYDDQGNIVQDPDQRVREAIKIFFRQFERLQSLMGVIRYFHEHELRFPTRRGGGDKDGKLEWVFLSRQRGQKILHNPAYAGAYAYGRTRSWHERRLDGGIVERQARLPLAEWKVLMRGHFSGYISWEQYKANQATLAANAPRRKGKDGPGSARSGAALLVGVARCGICDQRMRARYGSHGFSYLCNYAQTKYGASRCQQIPDGAAVDAAVAEALLAALTPAQVSISLAVLEELGQQEAQIEQQWKLQLEQVRYEAERARRQYDLVEPEHRLVARTLEAAWEEKLEALTQLEWEYEQHRRRSPLRLDSARRAAVEALSEDLSRVWAAETTKNEERKQIVRLLLEKVTLKREEEEVLVTLHWQTEAVTSLSVPLRRQRRRRSQTSPEVIDLVREMSADRTDAEIAEALNAKGYRSARGLYFTVERVAYLRRRYEIGKERK